MLKTSNRRRAPKRAAAGGKVNKAAEAAAKQAEENRQRAGGKPARKQTLARQKSDAEYKAWEESNVAKARKRGRPIKLQEYTARIINRAKNKAALEQQAAKRKEMSGKK